MDKQSVGELNILKEIQSDGKCSQRELALRSGLALSYLNVYLKGLIRKGYVSVRDMPGRRLWYNITPAGIAEKARMTMEYMKWSLSNYRDIRERVGLVCHGLKKQNNLDVVICGVSDAAEIFYIAALDFGLRIVAVVDDLKAGEKWLNFTIRKLSHLKDKISYDIIVIGDVDNCLQLARELSDLDISDEKYLLCTGQRIRSRTVVQIVE